jgi:PBP1b-binding outer membrane lipoprotein LpoB
MTQIKTIITISVTALVLGACTPKQSLLEQTPADTTAPITIESSGDAEKDAQAIESELNNLDEAIDFPDLTASDLGL